MRHYGVRQPVLQDTLGVLYVIVMIVSGLYFIISVVVVGFFFTGFNILYDSLTDRLVIGATGHLINVGNIMAPLERFVIAWCRDGWMAIKLWNDLQHQLNPELKWQLYSERERERENEN